jgi:DNA primase
VREFGAHAFEQQIGQAVPLSRMLLQTAQDGADLTTPEGRARMLAQARALIEQLPAGLLREQILVEVARAGAVSADQLRTQWGGRPDAPITRPGRPRMSGAMTQRRTSRNTATLLDRVVWLLLQRSGLWEDIGDDDRLRMASQPAPYSTFFSLLERGLHEHGVLSRAALLHWLQENGAQDGDLAALVERSEALHDLSDEVDALAELQAAALRLQEQQVIDELNLLAESGDMSSSQRERYEELHRVRVGLAARSMARPESSA